ncbi:MULTISPECIES: hypothetical protein [Calothrix]|uniref:Uncharacterized protein n=2 Tax=Calothrix TaxID=1186 RepID=A0ABR8A6Z7_9CYAN|nr:MULTISPECIES: hypothetical protein [Calothrix]MBD2195250.1 hypothetical protein [Calothrix parietina FACHB-288]MBD2223779.1 hypothetical protein [Calothrix anomala FACHB-343]
MTELRIQEAYEFYRKYIYNEELISLLREYNIRIPGSISPQIWELFGAILTGDRGTGSYGADLSNYEVKSSIDNNSFEYQYHLRTGRNKLLKDMAVDHLYVSYSRDYKNVTVRKLTGDFLKEIFQNWLPGLEERYSTQESNRRYRKNISYSIVKAHGQVVMSVQDGILTYPLIS